MRKLKLFLFNAVLLTATTLFLRTVMVSWDVYISNKLGAAGSGLYQLIFSVYTFAVTFATSGINLAATRLVAEELGRGSESGAKKAMVRCLLYALFFGLASAWVLYSNAEFVSVNWLMDERCIRPMKLLCFTLPFISMGQALGGYFTAVRRVAKSASAQIFEQFLRISVCVALLNFVAPPGMENACLALIGGGCVAEFGSFVYIYILYLLDKRRYKKKDSEQHYLTRRMLNIALPVALSSYLRSGLMSVKQMMVPTGLKKHGVSKNQALAQYGMVKGMVLPVVLFPSAFLTAFASLLVPELAECYARNDRKRINYVVSHVLQITLLFAIGAAGVLLAFSGELGQVIYKSRTVGMYIGIMAPLVVAMYLDIAVDGMLKGVNEQVSSMRYNVIESVISIVLVFFLLPVFGINGYLMEIFSCEILNGYLSARRLLKVTDCKLLVFQWVIKPVACITVSVIGAKYLMGFGSAGFLCTAPNLIMAVVAAALLYILLLRLIGCITHREMMMVKSIFRS